MGQYIYKTFTMLTVLVCIGPFDSFVTVHISLYGHSLDSGGGPFIHTFWFPFFFLKFTNIRSEMGELYVWSGFPLYKELTAHHRARAGDVLQRRK